MIRDEIKNIIEKVINVADFVVETPKDRLHGDYSTNVALISAKKLNKNPLEVAKEILAKIKSPIIERVEVAGPGFINFYLSKDFFIEGMKKIDKNFGRNNTLKNKKIIIEYTDPNPFKEFHIGHLMSNSIGESISRILEFHGAKIKRANYQGDVGLHVAKAIWGMMKIKENPKFGSGKIKDLSFAYAYGAKEYESNNSVKEEIKGINEKVYERSDKEINKLYNQGKKWSLKHFDEIYRRLGTEFDYYFFESEVAGIGKKIVEESLKKGIFKKGDKGAIVFKGEKHGLHTRVFINSDGLPTYEAKELGLAKVKYNRCKYDKSVIVTANEQNEYFKVVLSAMSEVFPDLAQRTLQIGHGMMRLPEGKMSSRMGQVVTTESLIEKAKELIIQKIADRGFTAQGKSVIAEQVAIGALKYSILKQSIGSNIIYDFEKSISFEGDSGPYLQYSFARANSVLEKAKKEKIKSDPNLRIHPNDPNNLERIMIHFPEVVEEAGLKYEPHLISSYLIELAREFNNYYAKNKIVDKNDEFSPYKIALTEAFSIIIKNGLYLLGINVLNKM
ncbi:MAG: arginine--tRNA ligase [Patescibacteria group bacterium]